MTVFIESIYDWYLKSLTIFAINLIILFVFNSDDPNT